MNRLSCSIALALAVFAGSAIAAEPVQVVPADLHVQALQPATQTYLVYFHGAPDTGFKRTMLATTQVARERVDGADAWVITQHWQDETGVVHTARTVHAAKDLATLSQTSMWNRPNAQFTTTVEPKLGRGTIEGTMPDPAREKAQAGFKAMKDGWWMNWHSDLTLLPLLPYEKGGTLRIRLFDVGMDAPMDVDYTVVGERTLTGGDGTRHDCWLVETESGQPGKGNYQRFWIDKARRVVIKEEDVFNGMYRSKVLLSVPAVVEFPLSKP
ncbi:hypothetical protein LF41_596 [Lysobacter dokdonensis DS-58]|uniref:DUF3108 domain containing protein n=1 Tax=Lysobacter dokdonensis DS-58 TaxID=1300345 RepID=A0A0A2WJZ3_9GAMM|nr:hypothetical protein [Lysobacter dokdonensis]KGQ18570.1 hypothetical protein LF41_596 [Lysobacter dokdonensis DS-58]